MAGITDGKFCSKMAKYGFDLLTIGGYNADQGAINAGLKIIKRGRPEFDVAEEELVTAYYQRSQIYQRSKPLQRFGIC